MKSATQRISPYPTVQQPAGEAERDGLIPGDRLKLRNVTVRRGRETGYTYELDKPLTVVRPTPEGNYLDTVKTLEPVDRDTLQYTAGQTLKNLRLDVVSFSTVGRPNPDDASTTVHVRTATRRAPPKEWIF